ncbi:hypothetical protein NMG60_11023572 [Bertholletia excelsa]
MTSQVVKVRREAIAACMTCPLCKKLLRDATSISLCLHTFCRKCIYKKLSDEEVDTCPVCNIDLGCVPVEKLRPDHNLQDIRAKIFPFKKRKNKAPEIVPSISLPVKRKERSLSSLVVSTPEVTVQNGLTGRRTKSVARKSAPGRGSSLANEEPIKKEPLIEDTPERLSPSGPETLNKIPQDQRQISSPTKPFHDQLPNKDKKNDAEAWDRNVDLWKPLNCLVEVANRTKSSKFSPQDSSTSISEPVNAPDYEVKVPKFKVKEYRSKSKVQDDKKGKSSLQGLVKRRRMRALDLKTKTEGLSASAQAILDAHGAKQSRKKCPIWFSLVASEDQGGEIPLPQISACYLRIKWRYYARANRFFRHCNYRT